MRNKTNCKQVSISPDLDAGHRYSQLLHIPGFSAFLEHWIGWDLRNRSWNDSPKVPNFNCAVLRTGIHPMPITMEPNTSDISRVAIITCDLNLSEMTEAFKMLIYRVGVIAVDFKQANVRVSSGSQVLAVRHNTEAINLLGIMWGQNKSLNATLQIQDTVMFDNSSRSMLPRSGLCDHILRSPKKHLVCCT